jgi:hypothetical protein
MVKNAATPWRISGDGEAFLNQARESLLQSN